MQSSSEMPMENESNPMVELLNQTCLDLVAEINDLKKENHRLKKNAQAPPVAGHRKGGHAGK